MCPRRRNGGEQKKDSKRRETQQNPAADRHGSKNNEYHRTEGQAGAQGTRYHPIENSNKGRRAQKQKRELDGYIKSQARRTPASEDDTIQRTGEHDKDDQTEYIFPAQIVRVKGLPEFISIPKQSNR